MEIMRFIKTRIRALALIMAAVVVLVGAPLGWALSEGTEEIRLGMSTALTGPAAQLGLNMRIGVNAAFDEANRAGGSTAGSCV